MSTHTTMSDARHAGQALGVDSEKELVMDYEFRQFGGNINGTDRPHWLYDAHFRSSPIGLVEFAQGTWCVMEWRPAKDVRECCVATMPGDIPVAEVLSAAKTILLRLKQ